MHLEHQDLIMLTSTTKGWAAQARCIAHRDVKLAASTAVFTFFNAVRSNQIQYLSPYGSCVQRLHLKFNAIVQDSDSFWLQAGYALGAMSSLDTLVFEFTHCDGDALLRWAAIASSFPKSFKCLKMEPRSIENYLTVSFSISCHNLVVISVYSSATSILSTVNFLLGQNQIGQNVLQYSTTLQSSISPLLTTLFGHHIAMKNCGSCYHGRRSSGRTS